MNTGALIVAAGKSSRMGDFKPMMKIGSITVVERLILTLQQAGCGPVVLVTGYRAEELEHHVSKMNVICIRNEAFEDTEMFDSVKLGLAHIKNFCEQLVFTPVDVPMFTLNTLLQLKSSGAKLAVPVCHGEEGHPLLVHVDAIPGILGYRGQHGLFGALQQCGYDRMRIEVEDKGTLLDADTVAQMDTLLKYHNSQMFAPVVNVKMAKEKVFFSAGTALLLTLLETTGSMKEACRQMNLSYTNGWSMINRAEEQLGYEILKRQHGGKSGGGATLTPKGKTLLERYTALEKDIRTYAQEAFARIFPDYL